MNEVSKQLYTHLKFLYGVERAPVLARRLAGRLSGYKDQHPDLAERSKGERLSERDVFLITYGDMVRGGKNSHLRTLGDFLIRQVAGTINSVHILPFFPYSSDDGYAVIDYQLVNPELGDWDDVTHLKDHFRLMFDGVFNHISTRSEWFLSFRTGEMRYKKYFIIVEAGTDVSTVFRPRATPLLSLIKTDEGEILVWTTYSADQIDLNFCNPEVLFEIVEILLLYIARGAEFIRLDGAAYYWKEMGTSCINLPQTHHIIQLMRSVLDIVAPHVSIITQANVPHLENIAYFGDGEDEAQLVFNFALPALTLHAFHTRNAEILSSWAEGLDPPPRGGAYFNFLAGHDGIGLLPVADIIEAGDFNRMAERIEELGGGVSYKSNQDGTLSPYELNINYLDALDDPGSPQDNVDKIARRFLASQAILLSLRGVPGIYFHSLFGSRNWIDGVRQTGQARTINRQKLNLADLEDELNDPHSLRHLIFQGYSHLLQIRTSNKAFHPGGGQKILHLDECIFSLLRSSPDQAVHVLCLHNLSPEKRQVIVDLDQITTTSSGTVADLIQGTNYEVTGGKISLTFDPYQVVWLQVLGTTEDKTQ